MASVNKVILIGNVGRDPETKYMSDGSAVCNLTLATTRRYKDKSGQQQSDTEWHRVSLFGRLAEIAEKYVKKGDPLFVTGRLRTRKYTARDGSEKQQTEVIAEEIQLLSAKSSSESTPAPVAHSAPKTPTPKPSALTTAFPDEDVPF